MLIFQSTNDAELNECANNNNNNWFVSPQQFISELSIPHGICRKGFDVRALYLRNKQADAKPNFLNDENVQLKDFSLVTFFLVDFFHVSA